MTQATENNTFQFGGWPFVLCPRLYKQKARVERWDIGDLVRKQEVNGVSHLSARESFWAKEVGNKVYEKRQNLKFQTGMNEAPFGPIGMKICRTAPPSRAFARGKGFRVPWGAGKKLKNVSFSGHFF